MLYIQVKNYLQRQRRRSARRIQDAVEEEIKGDQEQQQESRVRREPGDLECKEHD